LRVERVTISTAHTAVAVIMNSPARHEAPGGEDPGDIGLLELDVLVPEDHGHALFEELARHLPWLRNTPEAGVHPVHGAPSGRDANLMINRRVKLALRLPIDRLSDARALVGKRINPGSG